MNRILILDFGSQYTQLIARRIREANVYCEIHPYHFSLSKIKEWKPDAIILSGSPSSVFNEGAPLISTELFSLRPPILGICYGMQLTAHFFGGKVEATGVREYGDTLVTFESHPLFEGLKSPASVWMSHGDHITKVPPDFESFATSPDCKIVAFFHRSKPIYGVQFHPEVTHTPEGATIIQNFLFRICKLKPDWNMSSFAEEAIRKIRLQVGDKRVICGLSGGVDSAVAAVLIHKAIGDRLTCIFVDNGLLRANERQKVEQVFRKNFGHSLIVVDASKFFLEKLAGVTHPETKRKIIGKEFITVFESEARKIPEAGFLAQGTLYPDVIESVSFKGPSAVIKSHHNVGGLPEKMGLKLVEPLRELFKDEVRALGKTLGMPEEILGRQPFPGPGLAVRIIGEVTKERLEILRNADDVMMQEIKKAGWYNKTWQTFCVLLPIKTVGVMGDERTYENVVALRSVESLDGMTADWARLPYDLLGSISNRIINEVKGVNRVVFDISSKPPATIEWE